MKFTKAKISALAGAAVLVISLGATTAACSSGGGSSSPNATNAGTITSCILDDTGSPESGYTLVNNGDQLTDFQINVGYYQDGAEFSSGNDSPTVAAHSTYTGVVDDAGQQPPNAGPMTCKILNVQNLGPSNGG